MQTNAVRFDIRERDKRLSCRETLALASLCTFSVFRDGAALERDGWLIFRLMKCITPGSPPDDMGYYGLSAVQYTNGVSAESAVLREWWLVNLLCHLPVGTVTQLAVTAVDKEEGVIGEGVVDILVGTVAEVTKAPYYDPEERLALFKGERGHPGIAFVEGKPLPQSELDPAVSVAIDMNAEQEKIRDVPPCPVGSYDENKPYVLVAYQDGTYGWAKIPDVKVTLPPLGSIPGKIKMVKSGNSWSLKQTTYNWDETRNLFVEDEDQYSASVPTTDHINDHTDGVL